MNILFFLTPKSEVEFVYDDFSLRQTIEKMEYHRFSEVPVIDREGRYVSTITEGDLLWYIKEEWNLDIREAENVRISGIKRKRKTTASRTAPSPPLRGLTRSARRRTSSSASAGQATKPARLMAARSFQSSPT